MNARQLLRRTALHLHHRHPAGPGVTVLIYHRVGGGSDSSVDLPTDVFREQMRILAGTNEVLSLDAAADSLQRGEHAAGVVLTFDDGAADFCDVAVPILAELGLPATLYLVTSAPDAGRLPWGVPAVSWKALRDAQSTGLVSVQSHTHDHTLLHRTGSAEAARQLTMSVAAITDQLGHVPQHFAYPKAVAGNAAARAEVAARFRTAALAGHRVNRSAADLLRLGRVPITRADDLELFRAKADGGLRLEGLARDLYGHVRYRKVRT